jgi:hypothetical protein
LRKVHRDVAYNIYKREVVATGQLKDYISIYQRSIAQEGLNDLAITENVTLIWSCFAKMIVISESERFDGINTVDRPTHRVILPFYQRIYALDKNSLFIYRGVKISTANPRYFKLISVGNMNEQDEYCMLLVKETGFTVQSASLA